MERDEFFFSGGFLNEWDTVLAKMNGNKDGEKFVCPDPLVLAIGYMRICFHL